MKNNFTIFVLITIFCSSCNGQNNFQLIENSIAELKSESPNHDGIVLNFYSIQDLDNDGFFEIIETSNRIESTSVGLLNSELSKAFEFDKIYVLSDNKYVESESDIGNYLENKEPYYEMWKKIIANPINLNADSQMLLKENRESFLNEIDWILKRINEKK